MAPGKRGPKGSAPAPLSWLASTTLPIIEFPNGAEFFRCHRTKDDPVFFGPAPGADPRFRFDAPGGEFRVLYLGLTPDAAIVETLCRNVARRTVDLVDLELRSLAKVTSAATLRLVKCHGDGLAQLGTTAALATGPYTASRRWALELWRHPDQPDGLLYASRHNPDFLCIACFNRPHATFSAITAPLLADAAGLAAILRRHGKSISI
jgi:hypothetical protein